MMMNDRVGGSHGAKILSNALAEECTLFSSTESLLGRLNQIDLRLRQLEKQQQQQQQRRMTPSPDNSYFIEDLRARHLPCKALSSALHEAHLKGTLMERVHQLECRIRQLSHELGKDSGVVSSAAGTNQQRTSDQNMWGQQIEREMKPQQDNAVHSSTCEIGAGELQAQLSKLKIKDTRREAITAVEKRANKIRRKQNRRQAHTQLYKKWFPVGC